MAPSLPTEIIQLILSNLRSDASESAATTLSVSAISRHWRAVVLSTPSLWSAFSFCLRTHDETMLSAFFERSLREPLRITISIDVLNASEVDASAIQRALTVFLREADRIERLHLRFLSPMHCQSDLLGQFVCFQSSGLKYLEIESLADHKGRTELISELFPLVKYHEQTWSECCPALTHITCTDLRLLVDGPSNMTSMSIRGVPGRKNMLDVSNLYDVLFKTKALEELVIDRMSLHNPYDVVSLPHLHTLSLLSTSHDSISVTNAKRASFLKALNDPALYSLTIHDLPHTIQGSLHRSHIRMPSITCFAVIIARSQEFPHFPTVFPNVYDLVLLGSDPELLAIASLSDDSWPHLGMIDLTKRDPPPLQHRKDFSQTLCQYGLRRVQSGHPSRVLVWLPRGILPEDLTPEAGEFMDLRAA